MASSVKPFDATNPAFGELDARSAAALLAVAGDIALVMDGAGVIRDVAVMGGGDSQFDTAAQWIGRPWNETVSGDSRAKIDTLVKEAVHQGVSKRRQVNHVMGDVMDVPVSYTTIKLGRDGSLVAVGRDMRHVSALQQRLVEAQQAMERDYWRLRHVETRFRLL
ncbi:MAG: transcriptional regulator PpsR, partial [Gemmatimonas sp.]